MSNRIMFSEISTVLNLPFSAGGRFCQRNRACFPVGGLYEYDILPHQPCLFAVMSHDNGGNAPFIDVLDQQADK